MNESEMEGINYDVEAGAVSLVKKEKTAWETGTCFVTEKVAFNMRELIRLLRKNYWGIFDKPVDTSTGRKKTWVPLTKSMVEGVLKNIDLDTKDINFRALKSDAIGTASIIRHMVKRRLDEIGFGEYLDEFIRSLCIDGTAVWKTYKDVNEEGESYECIQLVDLLNFYIDPTVRSIKEAPAVIERAVLTLDAVKAMKGWENLDKASGSPTISRNESLSFNTAPGATPLVEVYERWGEMPKCLITGKESDKGELVFGRIVVSNLEHNAVVHLIEEVKSGKKPYEEGWYTRIPGRWYGEGPAEKVMWLQQWMNTVVNIRINRSYVSQLGLFKIRKGSNITPQMLSRLPANGAIQVNDMQDIEQLPMQDASMASYKDEEVISMWSEKVTSAYETATGEQLPSSTSATGAVIQARATQSQFTLVRKGIGLFLQRWMKRQFLPIMFEQIDSKEVRISGDMQELRDFDERVANKLIAEKLEEMNARGVAVDPAEVMQEHQRILEQLSKMGMDRFVKFDKKDKDEVDLDELDVEMYVTNEEMDKGVMLQNLVAVFQTLPAIPNSDIEPGQILASMFDIMGLDSRQFSGKGMKMQQLPPQVGNLPQAQQLPQNVANAIARQPTQTTEQQVVTNANTL